MTLFERIHISGASGAGVSTLGRAIAARRNIPCFDADDYYWLPTIPAFRVKRDLAARLDMLSRDLSGLPRWVLSGSMDPWGQAIVATATLIIFVETPTELRLQRLRLREAERFGEAIAPGGSMFEQHQFFLDWAAQYESGHLDGRNRPRHEKWLATLAQPIIRIDGAEPIEAQLSVIFETPIR
jgi:adenylate kinase family enzyme